MIFKIIIILIAVFFIFRLLKNYNQEKSDIWGFLVWLLVWIAVIVFMVHPTLGSDAAKFFGIGRGTDLVFFIAFIIMFYFVFRLYTKTTAVESDVTETVKYIALINRKLDEKNRRKK